MSDSAARGSALEPIIVVSGLPRSGTSLMMQLLRAGGIPVLTDDVRTADVSNPKGYFEYEKVKWLAADNTWLSQAHGHAIKVIAQLVPFLPRGLPYRMIFMDRDLDEVLQSQKSMITALGKPVPGESADLGPVFRRQLAAAQEFARSLPDTRVESIRYRELIDSPAAAVEKVIRFLDRPDLDQLKMVSAIDTSLYRSRSSGS